MKEGEKVRETEERELSSNLLPSPIEILPLRPKMLAWILSLKQPDGSYLVHVGGEVDVRASYCVMCITLLLGICTPEIVEGMGDFVAG